MFKSNRYGQCIERFGGERPNWVVFLAVMLVLHLYDFSQAPSEYWNSNAPLVALVMTGIVGYRIFPGSACLRAFSKGVHLQGCWAPAPFIEWQYIMGFETKGHDSGPRLVILADPSIGIGRRFEVELNFKQPVEEVASRLCEIHESIAVANVEPESDRRVA